MTLLEVARLGKAFGGNRVLHDVSFLVEPGEIVGLLGPNGSGKSTLLNIASGFIGAETGSVRLLGQELTGKPPHEIVGHGIARTFQLPSMPAKMSVLEVVLAADCAYHGVASTLFRSRAARRTEQEAIARAKSLLDELLLTGVRDLPAAAISGGQKKLLSIACALMRAPKLLMLDEPTAGVHPNLRNDIVRTLKQLNRGGVSQLIVEHDMHFVREVCTRCLVLDRGEIVADCRPHELGFHPRVVEAYLGAAAMPSATQLARAA
jgi:branched-chain amino acid transport system ATP-binding protein